MKKRILTIGHSYVVGVNRSIVNRIAQEGEFDITVIAPETFRGSLRRMRCDTPLNSHDHLVMLPVSFDSRIHFFYYKGLEKYLLHNRFDLIHLWEEPYLVAGNRIAKLAVKSRTPYFFWTAQNLNKRYPFPFNRFEKYVVDNAQAWVAGAGLVKENLIARGYCEADRGIRGLSRP